MPHTRRPEAIDAHRRRWKRKAGGVCSNCRNAASTLAASSQKADTRLETIYLHARKALYATLDESAIADVAPRCLRNRTSARSRDDYLAHPAAGERLRDEDARALSSLYRSRQPQVQLIISDGLNADAINEHIRALVPPLRRLLSNGGHHVGEIAIVVDNGRVRAGYEIGGLVGAGIVVHVIGERPGTGLNTASAYLTYGRDETGRPRWSRGLDHSATTQSAAYIPGESHRLPRQRRLRGLSPAWSNRGSRASR
jgi:ethanolamine ammonia-lyase large subunit